MEKLGFEKIKIITTREPRSTEKNNYDKIFVNKDELNQMVKNGEIAYKFDMLGNTYAYSKESLFTEKNTVFEMHYWTIDDFKKICPNLCAIYLMPKDINIAKEKLHERHLSPQIEKDRLLEIDEHFEKINNSDLLKKFDYVLYNNYDEESENQVINLVKKLITQ
jgi:guanylate kinase